jgi:hypothetical protein
LKSAQFRRERAAAWSALEVLVSRCERESVRALSADEIIELSTLYQNGVGSLATARAISLDRNVVDYLESLVARAHLCVYGFRQRPSEAVRAFVVLDFPDAVRRWRWFVTAAMAFLVAAVIAGSALVAADEDRYYAIVAIERAQGRTPAATTAALRAEESPSSSRASPRRSSRTTPRSGCSARPSASRPALRSPLYWR